MARDPRPLEAALDDLAELAALMDGGAVTLARLSAVAVGVGDTLRRCAAPEARRAWAVGVLERYSRGRAWAAAAIAEAAATDPEIVELVANLGRLPPELFELVAARLPRPTLVALRAVLPYRLANEARRAIARSVAREIVETGRAPRLVGMSEEAPPETRAAFSAWLAADARAELREAVDLSICAFALRVTADDGLYLVHAASITRLSRCPTADVSFFITECSDKYAELCISQHAAAGSPVPNRDHFRNCVRTRAAFELANCYLRAVNLAARRPVGGRMPPLHSLAVPERIRVAAAVVEVAGAPLDAATARRTRAILAMSVWNPEPADIPVELAALLGFRDYWRPPAVRHRSHAETWSVVAYPREAICVLKPSPSPYWLRIASEHIRPRPERGLILQFLATLAGLDVDGLLAAFARAGVDIGAGMPA